MGYFKLDKIDKIVISFTFIIVTLFCILNNFCFASELLEGVQINKAYLSQQEGKVIYREDGILVYYPLSYGHKYQIVNNSGNVISFAFFDKEPEIGDTFTGFNYLQNGTNKTFLCDDEYLVFSVSSSRGLNNVKFYDETPGLSGAIGNLTLSTGVSQLWTVFQNSIPYILVVVIFSLGVWFIKHNIIEHSKGREY